LKDSAKTITAIATPPGNGAIAIIRVSGPKAISLVDLFFRGRVPLSQAETRRLYLGQFYFTAPTNSDFSALYDQVMVVVFRAPHSYTTDDMVEIHCHGSRFIAEKIIDTLVSAGAVLAEPGEFTWRAFMNGRLDLSQAEAVADLIKAESDFELQNSLRQLEGYFTSILKKLRQEIVEIISLLELELDFAEEEIEFVDRPKILAMIEEVEVTVRQYLQSFDRAKILREGARIVLIGKPNVGKSSLLNVFLKESRAIVTEFPGTTRDVLEEQVTIHGTRFRVFDTAGICETANPIEQEGIRRTLQRIQDADILLIVFDGSMAIDPDDVRVFDVIRPHLDSTPCIFILNTNDKPLIFPTGMIHQHFENPQIVSVSALENRGIFELSQALQQRVSAAQVELKDEYWVTNLRHKQALTLALNAVRKARETVLQQFSEEYIVSDLTEASENLGKIIGAITADEVLNNIFSKFCIGK